MKVAVIGNKGGTGKTSIAVHIAWKLAQKFPVLLVDTDYGQGSAFRWVTGVRNVPQMNTVYRVPHSPGLKVIVLKREAIPSLPDIIAKREEDFFVIDGRPEPWVSGMIAEALDAEDIGMIVVDSASIESVRQATDLWQAIKKAGSDVADYYVVVNKFPPTGIVNSRWISQINSKGLKYLLAIPRSELFQISEKSHVPVWEIAMGNRMAVSVRFAQIADLIESRYYELTGEAIREVARYDVEHRTGGGVPKSSS